MAKQEPEVRQAQISLSYFDYEVPVIYVDNTTPYIPVIELCKMLGLRAETHIPQWRKLVLWNKARKLPYQTPKRGRRMVWCLHAGVILFWFSCFDWSLALPERRVQLEEATYEGMKVLDQIYQEMQARYKAFRRQLFEFLTTYSDIETTLTQLSALLHVYLDDFDVCVAWEDLIDQGKTLIDETIRHARGILQEQAKIPVIDAVRIDTHGQVIEESALPLFPLVEEEDIRRFFENLEKVVAWHQQIMNFLSAHGIIWDREQKKWYLA